MESESKYLSFEEYKELGGTLEEESPFTRLEYNARKIIDKYTFGRLMDLETQEEVVKRCMFELIETISSYTTQGQDGVQNKNVASESTDGYSISYGAISRETLKTKTSELMDIVYTYLSNYEVNGVPCLYRGFD